MLLTMGYDVGVATGETLLMVLVSTLVAVIIGLPLGTLLFVTDKIKPNSRLNYCIETFINISRSVPFIILLVALIPFTRLVMGTSIGLFAAMVPLSLGAAPFFARLAGNVYQELPVGLIEAGFSMGATTWQMIRCIALPEARTGLIQAVTVTAVTLVNYSAMAGTVGGGGLGDLAIRYGYQRFDAGMMITTVVVLVGIVQLLQMLGDRLVRHYKR